jgi:sodium-independent sulfate anion transporter 11
LRVLPESLCLAFGRLNNYKINPNQELIAIGVTNTVGSCFGAYAATGSFSRTALKSKCGVRTPLAGVITGIVVLVALYGLTDAFYWIPNAGLSAVIIHAVADLVASPSHVYSFWRVSPLEFFIWLAAVLVTIFTNIENGIYTSIGASIILLLVRVAHPRRNILGRITIQTGDGATTRAYVPLEHDDFINPNVKVKVPSPGIIVYRLHESYIYPNASATDSQLVDYVRENFRRGLDMSNVSNSERAWNDPGPPQGTSSAEVAADNEAKPDLRAIVLDFTATYICASLSLPYLKPLFLQVRRSILPVFSHSSMRDGR